MLFQNMKGEIPGKESYTIWPVCDDKLTSMKVKNKTKKKTSIVNA